MRVLVACEFSGIVRDAFAARGHDAWSCDLLPTERPGNHIQGDVLSVLDRGWDLMVAHPPCTYLAKCGLQYLRTQPDRLAKHEAAFEFVLALWESEIPKVSIENPQGWLGSNWGRPSQVIQPYHFGDPHQKTTCLWLKNLPILFATQNVGKPEPLAVRTRNGAYRPGQKYYVHWRDGKTAHDRSRTFPGIAKAMAEQWG